MDTRFRVYGRSTCHIECKAMNGSLSRVKKQDRYAQGRHLLQHVGHAMPSNGFTYARRDRFIFDGRTLVRLLALSNLLARKGFRSLLDC